MCRSASIANAAEPAIGDTAGHRGFEAPLAADLSS